MAGATSETTPPNRSAAAVGLAVSLVVPIALIVIGIAALGADGIDWASAVVWGVVGTAAFTAFGVMGQKMGMTEMDILDILGSAVADPGTAKATGVGAVMHHINGAVLAVTWAYGVALLGLPATWVTGLLWGAILTVLALVMMSSLAPFHPAMLDGRMRDPGVAATNFGRMTPVGSLMGHLVYGLVLGLGYDLAPIG